MNIWDKIEEIRQKPEHIRLRYVWGCVAVSMVFVLAIWSFSFQSSGLTESNKLNLTTEQRQVFEQFGDQKRSLEETGGVIKKTLEQAQTQAQNQTQTQSQTQIDEQTRLFEKNQEQDSTQETIPDQAKASEEGFAPDIQTEKQQ